MASSSAPWRDMLERCGRCRGDRTGSLQAVQVTTALSFGTCRVRKRKRLSARISRQCSLWRGATMERSRAAHGTTRARFGTQKAAMKSTRCKGIPTR
eukprot:1337741-Rhodomonas_salina.2